MTALIQFCNLHYRPIAYSDAMPDILNGISLDVEQGEFVAIIGANGSGKTTLIKHLNGLLLPTGGHVLVNGLDTRQEENRSKLNALVGMVFQNPADQILSSTVEEDVAFGLENLNLPTQEIRSRVYGQLSAIGLINEAERPPHLLSGGQIQKVALAGVLARQPDVIIFDEPTSMLDPVTRDDFLGHIIRLHQQGTTIIYVTHHMEEAVHADKVVALCNGEIALSGSPNQVFRQKKELYEMGLDIPDAMSFADHFRSFGWQMKEEILTPEDLLAALPPYQYTTKSKSIQNMHNQDLIGEEIIDIQDVHYTYLENSPLAKHALTGVNLTARTDRILGIAGTNGSGKSTLLQHINGILRPSKGSIRVGTLQLENPETSLRDVIRKVGLVFQNPETQFFNVFVGDEIAYGPKQFEMNDVRNRVRQAMEHVGLDFELYKDRPLETLSGGEKRKVALASTLILDQDILLFDEPTAGMDPRSRDELLELFRGLNKQGKTIIIASHRLEELAYISHSLAIMRAGKVDQVGLTHRLLVNTETLQGAGLLPPLAVKVSQKLREIGWPINIEEITTPDHLFSAIARLSQ